jgi:CheY-like chemotaxis protein
MASAATILVVEDDPDIRVLMATWLGSAGYVVYTANNGYEALTVLERVVPCVMVVDLMMPVMDGAVLRRHQQEMAAVSSVPFILVSAELDAERVARELDIAEVVAKPFEAERLLRIVAAHCTRNH